MPATTMSQSTARLKPSEVARPKPTAPAEAHCSVATGQQPAQLAEAAAAGPEGVAIEQPLQLEQCPAGRRSGPRPSQRRPGAPGAW